MARFSLRNYKVEFERVVRGGQPPLPQEKVRDRTETSRMGWQSLAGSHLRPYPADGSAPPPNPAGEGTILKPRG